MTKVIDAISWLVVMESNRIPLFRNTLQRYVEQQVPFPVQICVATRTMTDEEYQALVVDFPIFDWAFTRYTQESKFYAPSKGFNEAFKLAKHETIFISFPEVRPVTNVWHQIINRPQGCYMCTVNDLKEDGSIERLIIGPGYRDLTPAYYFMAFYTAADIRAINGWDEDFATGYWYDDDEFGMRMHRQLLKRGTSHQTLGDVVGEHQWHSRGHYTPEGININCQKFGQLQSKPEVIRCKNGLLKE